MSPHPPGTGPAWRNWSGTAASAPRAVRTPTGTADVVAAVRAAAERGGTVKMVGTGHSFTAISAPEDLMLRPDRLSGVVDVDRSAMTVTALAGTPLHRFNADLERLGLSLHNMGDIAEQTLAGATSTGTHGTGGVAASLSAQVSGLELVTGDGTVLWADRDTEPEVFAAARLGLGALGILTRLRFDVEPLGVLEAHERPMRWADALAAYDDLTAGHHHTDLYWFPHTDAVLVKTDDRLDLEPGEAEPLGRLRRWVDDELVANTAFGALNAVGNRAPGLVPRFNRLAGRLLSERRYSDVPHRVFTSPRRVRFKEMEYAVPRADGLAVLAEVRRLVERNDWRIGFPVEVRHTPADDLVLGTSSGRESMYLAFHVNAAADHRDYFGQVERVLVAAGGRPHWGKLHSRTASDLAAAYPRWAEFASVRDRLDPQRVFDNDHLRRVLG
ncbi:D-arabinono-1,4-lactone oxidase [Nocardioides donggukensis]|uniref:FAD-binding protein n=1 Tax=Nocardioides donggukensis TaxID=2774019 RepID=A0A927K5Y2_9ACTN|nr:D-arabinono-1,4-lactone oxidase [Nocardioides donggukensis]MBD8869633.1 FAD-binding protein [Nocardioides donggukensis]